MISTVRVGAVVVATLSRPPVNAFDEALLGRLGAIVEEVAADPAVSVLHLRSNQKAFSAGADLAFMQACFAAPEGPDTMIGVVRRMQRLFARIESAPVVTLAEIDGAAVGGGLELALACDLRVAATDAKLGLPEADLGLLPAAGGTQRLTRLCGPGIARRLILGAELVDGTEAARLGLVQWAQPREQLARWTAALAQRIGAIPIATLAANKRCIAAALDAGSDGFADEILESRRLYDQPETRRRVAAFLARRAG
jgi:enoyl-CoA hydratase/carnithine racemase